MPAEKSYVHYLSFLKCIGMFAVIGIHVFCTPVSYWADSFDSVGFFISFFCTNVLRAWAVPVFVMVSGALFLGREVTVGKMYKKYIFRLVLVLLTFGTLYALMEIVFTAHSFSLPMILTALRNVYAGELWDHMWFIYMCIGLYIITPPLQQMLKQLDDTLLKYLLTVLFVFTCLVPFVNELAGVKFGVYIPVSTIWVFYYLTGYALHTEILKIDNRLGIVFISMGVLWCACGQFLPDTRNMYGAELKYAGTGSIITVLMSLGIFSLAKAKCKQTADVLDTVINPLSFGVYVVHAVFVNLCYKVLHITPDRYNVWLMWTIIFSVTAVGSLALVWLLRKISLIKKYIL